MNVSINPTYYCNFRCDWCYLTKDQLGDTRLLDLDCLNELLSKLDTVDHVDLYGGEIGLLSAAYIAELLQIIRQYTNNISVTSNLSAVPAWFHTVNLAVSYEFDAREKHDTVLRNMMLYPNPIHVIILAHDKIINKDVNEMIAILNSVQNVNSVEIKPYSINQANHHSVTHADFENFVKQWISSPVKKRFDFQNETKIQASINRTYNALSDDHIYITPNNRYAVLEFDLNDREYFQEFDDLDYYYAWCEKESLAVHSNQYCAKCKYLGHCLTEHYRTVESMETGCNGYYNLINWYEQRI